MISLIEVSKVYGLTAALSDFTANFDKGCNGLLGPNGAGKTTTLRLIAGLIKPDKGNVLTLGENPFNNPRVLKGVGYAPEFDEPFPWLSARKYLRKILRFYGFPKHEINRRVEEVIRDLGMNDFADRQIMGYSRGMLQRVKIAQAIIHDPEIVLLDEPMNGLDPIWRHRMINLIKKWRKEGKLVIYSTHLLFEAEKVCTKAYFIYRGTLVAHGELYEIRKKLQEYPHRVKIKVSNNISKLLKKIIDLPYVNSLQVVDRVENKGTIEVKVIDAEKFYREIPVLLLENNITLEEIESVDDNLDTLYKYILEVSKEV